MQTQDQNYLNNSSNKRYGIWSLSKSPGKGNRLKNLTDRQGIPPSSLWAGISKGFPTPYNVGDCNCSLLLARTWRWNFIARIPHISVPGLREIGLVLNINLVHKHWFSGYWKVLCKLPWETSYQQSWCHAYEPQQLPTQLISPVM